MDDLIHATKTSDPHFPDLFDPDVISAETIVDSSVFVKSEINDYNYEISEWMTSLFGDPLLSSCANVALKPNIKVEHSYSQDDESPLPSSPRSDVDSMSDSSSSDQATSYEYAMSATEREALFFSQRRSSFGGGQTDDQTVLQPHIITSTHQMNDVLQIPDSTVNIGSLQRLHNGTPLTPPSSSDSETYEGLPSSVYGNILPVTGAVIAADACPRQQFKRGQYPDHPIQQPSFQKIPNSGLLILSEEEKRTLISEGYPIPARLPLNKGEEKILKKIRRKIKNKISAQESRRKKKEYMDALERRVDGYSHENHDLKRKVDMLEGDNRTLLNQLRRLQSLVQDKLHAQHGSAAKISTPHAVGTTLMMMVLCFSVLLGSWSPLPVESSLQNPLPPLSAFNAPRPLAEDDAVDPDGVYTTPSRNFKSRVLLALPGELDPTCDLMDDHVTMPRTPDASTVDPYYSDVIYHRGFTYNTVGLPKGGPDEPIARAGTVHRMSTVRSPHLGSKGSSGQRGSQARRLPHHPNSVVEASIIPVQKVVTENRTK